MGVTGTSCKCGEYYLLLIKIPSDFNLISSYSQKFSQISPPALIGKNFIHGFLSCVIDYIEDMATFTALAKI